MTPYFVSFDVCKWEAIRYRNRNPCCTGLFYILLNPARLHKVSRYLLNNLPILLECLIWQIPSSLGKNLWYHLKTSFALEIYSKNVFSLNQLKHSIRKSHCKRWIDVKGFLKVCIKIIFENLIQKKKVKDIYLIEKMSKS